MLETYGMVSVFGGVLHMIAKSRTPIEENQRGRSSFVERLRS
jgi:hypothetical protein